MSIKLGVHAGPQDLPMDDLKRLWKQADEAGFHWISVWDHFYANPLDSRENVCFEAVAAMATLAADDPGAGGLSGILYLVSQSGPAGEGGHYGRSHQRRALRAGSRRRLVRGRVP